MNKTTRPRMILDWICICIEYCSYVIIMYYRGVTRQDFVQATKKGRTGRACLQGTDQCTGERISSSPKVS